MIKRGHRGAGYESSERCHVVELLNDATNPQVSLARIEVAPDTTTQLHSLNVDEWYVIEKGRGDMKIDDQPLTPLKAGDWVAISKGGAQQITNTGSGNLVFLCVCLPRYADAGYENLESE